LVLLDALGGGLDLEGEFGGEEGVVLSHSVLGAVEAVEDKLTEERETHLSEATEVVLAFLVDEKEVIALGFFADV
jgi:hypothetical protein